MFPYLFVFFGIFRDVPFSASEFFRMMDGLVICVVSFKCDQLGDCIPSAVASSRGSHSKGGGRMMMMPNVFDWVTSRVRLRLFGDLSECDELGGTFTLKQFLKGASREHLDVRLEFLLIADLDLCQNFSTIMYITVALLVFLCAMSWGAQRTGCPGLQSIAGIRAMGLVGQLVSSSNWTNCACKGRKCCGLKG